MDRATLIENRLRQALTPQKIEVRDDSRHHAGHEGAKGGGHFFVSIVSTRFQGRNPLQRHQMIYQALGDLMKKEIHALSIRALTPDEA